MSIELPFEYSQRREDLLRDLNSSNKQTRDAAIIGIEEGDKELEDYLASLTMGGGVALGSVFEFGDVATTTITPGNNLLTSWTMADQGEGASVFLNGQVYISFTPGSRNFVNLRLNKDGTDFGWNSPNFNLHVGGSEGSSTLHISGVVALNDNATTDLGFKVSNSSDPGVNIQQAGAALYGILLQP